MASVPCYSPTFTDQSEAIHRLQPTVLIHVNSAITKRKTFCKIQTIPLHLRCPAIPPLFWPSFPDVFRINRIDAALNSPTPPGGPRNSHTSSTFSLPRTSNSYLNVFQSSAVSIP